MAQLGELREGLRARLALIPDCQASAYMLANPTPPAMHVMPDETTYDLTMGRGHDRWTLKVQGFVGAVSDIGAQKRLDRWLAAEGPESVKAAIEGDKKLGGVASDTRVTEASGYRQVVLDGRGPLLMAEWTVEILATSS